MAEIEHSQWLAPAELERLKAARLTAMVEHAARNVPYYRERFRARAERISGPDARVPDDEISLLRTGRRHGQEHEAGNQSSCHAPRLHDFRVPHNLRIGASSSSRRRLAVARVRVSGLTTCHVSDWWCLTVEIYRGFSDAPANGRMPAHPL